MIASLDGVVLATTATNTTIEVGGVGFTVELAVPHAASLTLDERARIHTILITRQESLTLYGFATQDERSLFERLLSVTGVGPRSALSIIGALGTTGTAIAVQHQDATAFKRIPGIGPKSAAMIIMSLTGKLTRSPDDQVETPHQATSATTDPPARHEVTAALLALGWKPRAAMEALDAALASLPAHETQDVPTLLRQSLAQLGPAR